MSPFLKSPMPGTVVSVAVSVGETVCCVLTRPHIFSWSAKTPPPLPPAPIPEPPPPPPPPPPHVLMYVLAYPFATVALVAVSVW